jgi:hypothetical protein
VIELHVLTRLSCLVALQEKKVLVVEVSGSCALVFTHAGQHACYPSTSRNIQETGPCQQQPGRLPWMHSLKCCHYNQLSIERKLTASLFCY